MWMWVGEEVGGGGGVQGLWAAQKDLGRVQRPLRTPRGSGGAGMTNTPAAPGPADHPNAVHAHLQVGQRHPALASLRVEACPAVTGSGLATNGGYAALQHLWLEGCELINGWAVVWAGGRGAGGVFGADCG